MTTDRRGRSNVAVLALTQPDFSGCGGGCRDDVARLVLRSRHHVERVRVAVREDGTTVNTDEDALKLDLTHRHTHTSTSSLSVPSYRQCGRLQGTAECLAESWDLFPVTPKIY